MIPRLDTFFTVANVLSLLRAVLAVPIAVLILKDGEPLVIASLLVVAGATDWFDGQIARWTDTVTSWGKVLDPVADKVAIFMIGIALLVKGLLPLWLVGLVATRDMLIVAGGTVLSRGMGEVQESLWLGKIAVTAMAITMLAAVLRADSPVLKFCVWATAFFMVISFLQYLLRYFRLRSSLSR